jgi:hypothetical protein
MRSWCYLLNQRSERGLSQSNPKHSRLFVGLWNWRCGDDLEQSRDGFMRQGLKIGHADNSASIANSRHNRRSNNQIGAYGWINGARNLQDG